MSGPFGDSESVDQCSSIQRADLDLFAACSWFDVTSTHSLVQFALAASHILNVCALRTVQKCTEYQGGFSNRLLLKDVKLARGAAQAVREHTPMASMAESLWEGLCDEGYGDLDQGSIYEKVYHAKAVAPPPDV